VQGYNEAGLKSQPGELFTFTADVQGTLKPEEFQLEREVRVKNGCKVMYLVNSRDNPLRNGTLGIFVSHAGCHFIRVGNVDYALEQVTLTKKQYVYDKFADALELREIGSITQYPIKLAYALSIHKAQGLTFDEVTIDLRKSCFQRGQLYVALSRVKTPEGLRIIAP
jgi:ATP-dependent exoDNAse (exonuclease V) alpha subunit